MSDEQTPALPAGDYAIVEVLGHRTIIGRVEEVERFGTKLMSIQPLFNGALLDAVLIGGSSIYQFTPCSAATALKKAPTNLWGLSSSLAAIVPQSLLPAPREDADVEDADFAPAFLDDDDDEPFA